MGSNSILSLVRKLTNFTIEIIIFMLRAYNLELVPSCAVFSSGLSELIHHGVAGIGRCPCHCQQRQGLLEAQNNEYLNWFGKSQLDFSFTCILPLPQFHPAGEKCPVFTPRLRTHGESHPPRLPWSTMAQQHGGSLPAVAVDGIILLSQWCPLEEPALLLLAQPCANQVSQAFFTPGPGR